MAVPSSIRMLRATSQGSAQPLSHRLEMEMMWPGRGPLERLRSLPSCVTMDTPVNLGNLCLNPQLPDLGMVGHTLKDFHKGMRMRVKCLVFGRDFVSTGSFHFVINA